MSCLDHFSIDIWITLMHQSWLFNHLSTKDEFSHDDRGPYFRGEICRVEESSVSPLLKLQIRTLAGFSSINYRFRCGGHFRTSYAKVFTFVYDPQLFLVHSEAFPTLFIPFPPCGSFLILSSTRKRCAHSCLRVPVKLELVILSLLSIEQ